MERTMENSQSSSTSTTISPDNASKKQRKTSLPNTSATQSQMTAENSMYYEQQRLKTFDDNWTDMSIDPRKMAKIGFYFVGPGNKVTCPFCKRFFCSFGSFQVALSMHGSCPFICRFKTPNVPIEPASDLDDLLPPAKPNAFLAPNGRVFYRLKAVRD